jgi:hypothetical protein
MSPQGDVRAARGGVRGEHDSPTPILSVGRGGKIKVFRL